MSARFAEFDTGPLAAPPPRDAAVSPAELLAQAHALAQDFAQRAAHHDRTGEAPVEQILALFRSGLLRLTIARRDGGHGAGLALAQRVIRTLAAGDPAVALIVAMHYCHHAAIARSRRNVPGARRWPDALAQRIITDALHGPALINAIQVEPELGSPSFGGLPATLARRQGESWSISGHKRYATGSHLLSWLAVLAVTDETPARVGVFLVPRDTPGVRIVETWDPLGMRASISHDIHFDQARIPLTHAAELHLAAPGLPRDPLTLSWYFNLIASVYLGTAGAAQDWLVGFLRQRRPAALGGAALAELPTVQDVVGRIQLSLDAAQALLAQHAQAFDLDAPDALALGQVARYTAVENAVQAASLALDLAGNHGLSRDNPLERHYRDTQCARIHSPPNALLRVNAGRAALHDSRA